MKKLILTLSLIFIIIFSLYVYQNTTSANKSYKTPRIKYEHLERHQRKQQFERMLNLTPEQKMEAKRIHDESFEEIKPIMLKIHTKHQEKDNLKLSNLSNKEQIEQAKVIDKELTELRLQAEKIRQDNIKKFENILDKNQKTILNQLKNEGRNEFERKHPPRPLFKGLGPNYFMAPPEFKDFNNEK